MKGASVPSTKDAAIKRYQIESAIIESALSGAQKGTETLLKQIADRAANKDLSELGEKMVRDMGAQKTGTEEVAGKMCDVWEVKNLGSKSWVWKSVTLKVQVNMAGMEMNNTATKFEEVASIPEDRFAIPSDVTITEGPDVKGPLEGMKKGAKR